MLTRSPLSKASLRGCTFLFFVWAPLLLSVQKAVSQVPSWSPISKEELDLKDNPLAPGEAAMILHWEVQTDSAKSLETSYIRIKIFKEEGKKYADVEIPYVEDRVEVQNIAARTVAPDGQAVAFGGQVFDKVAARSRRFRVNLKAFTLPNVQAGSILEYSYSLHWHRGIPDVIKHPEQYIISEGLTYPAAQWEVQRELFVRHAHFVLRPFSRNARLEVLTIRLPNQASPQQQPDGTLLLDVENIQGIHDEENSPPQDARRGEIHIFYVVGPYFASLYWTDVAKRQFHEKEKFLAKSKAVHEEATRLVAANDSPEAKLHKLYNRVQQLRFVSFEPSKTEKEQKQENLRPNKNVEEVLTRGYAFANEANLLFVALAREAGFTAFPVEVASRRHNFFLKNIPDPSQFDAQVVEVQLGYKNIYLDPATLHCPFGLLPWEESDTFGIRLAEFNAGLVQIPPAGSADAIIERKGTFRLDRDGGLQGKLEVNFLGQEALERRINGHNQDDTAHKKELEEEARNWMPHGATVKLISATGWQGSDGPLNAVFEIDAPNFSTQAGDRLLFPIAVLQLHSKKPFQSSHRENPVYFNYGHREIDDLVLQAPEGYKLENLPVTRGMRSRSYLYGLSTEEKGTELKFKRNFVMETYYILPAQYPEFRHFYDFMRTNDEEQAVLRAIPPN